VGEGDAGSVDGGGEVGAEARHGGDGRDFSGVTVGAAVGDASPAGGVVVASVVGAEAFDEAGVAGVAVLAEPGVPAAAGVVGGDEELVVVGELGELPCGGGDGDDHLDLAEAHFGHFDGGGDLAGGFMTDGTLVGEEGHVVVAGDLEWGGGAVVLGDVLAEGSVDEAFVGAALLPDAGVDAAFEEDGAVIAGDEMDVAGECG